MRVAAAILSLALTLPPVPAVAQAVSPGEFEARATGRTLHFRNGGLPYGSEQFFAGRRTLWRAWDGTCQAGVWYDAGDLVCFLYDDASEPQCWRLRDAGGTLTAVLVEKGVEVGPLLDLERTDRVPLDCPAPEVGS